jgi:alpha-glucosidase
MKYSLFTFIILLLLTVSGNAQKETGFQITSPDGRIKLEVLVGKQITWNVSHEGQTIIAPSVIALHLKNGEVLGQDAKIASSKNTTVNGSFSAINYKKDSIADNYHQVVLNCKGDYGIIFRVYDDGVAYRFFTNKKETITVESEQANFNFDKDYKAWLPYTTDPRLKGDNFNTSFENLYNEIKLSQFAKDTLSFLPVLVELDNNKKAAVLEADLENYPGMYLNTGSNSNTLKGVFAPYPLEEKTGGYNNINAVVTKRADYLATVNGTTNFPWRAVVISTNDAQLANNDMVQRLAAPTRLKDVSWIKPGKVAWDWWNDWNITGVDFKAGINTPTYKYYIDFAAANKLEYIIIDEGWSNDSDLMQLSSAINLREIVDYGKPKNVGVILWATWLAVDRQMNEAFPKYAAMGIKGFKIDFLDRDDQKMTTSTYAIAAKAAESKLLVDFHGVYKPDGLQRTYPNVVNFEGVKGLENSKWAPNDDVPRYDVTLPFIRMMAGPMDYTPGAMRNAAKGSFRPVNSNPMSHGTRCHQLALYVVFDAPLQMLADNPTAYMKEQESTEFIAGIPTTFNETVSLEGKVSEYIAIAKRKEDTWYVGALTNWNARDMVIDLSFLKDGNYEALIMKDGVNADRNGTDYKKETRSVTATDKLDIHLAPGGGWAAIVRKKG